MGSHFFRVGAIEVRLSRSDILAAIPVLALLVFGFGLGSGGTGLGNIFRTRTGVGFFSRGS
jgi:hypothetical protein